MGKSRQWSLADYIRFDMQRRGMNVVTYAELVGVVHSTISKHLRTTNAPAPSEEFLRKLSKATSIGYDMLQAIAFPDLATTTPPSPHALFLALRIDKLPKPLRDEIERLIASGEAFSEPDDNSQLP